MDEWKGEETLTIRHGRLSVKTRKGSSRNDVRGNPRGPRAFPRLCVDPFASEEQDSPVSDTSTEPFRHEADIDRLAHEVRALRKIVIALLSMALVYLTVLTMQQMLSLPKYASLFDGMLSDRPLPVGTEITLRWGSSPWIPILVALLSTGFLAWLWLERKRPAAPIFAVLCLCSLLVVVSIWLRLSVSFPMQDLIFGMGAF